METKTTLQPVILQIDTITSSSSSSSSSSSTKNTNDKEYHDWYNKCHQISSRFHRILSKVFPILDWAPKYRREWIWSDLIAGLTLVSLHIPQAIAYARLANVSPIHGLYVSIIPVIIYALMGTSRQISIGTFAVVSIACRDVLTKFDNTNNSAEKNIEILSTLAFLIGLIQIIVGILKLGALKALISDALISAFIGASTLHVLTSQIGTLFGLDESIKHNSGMFSLIRTWYLFMKNILRANFYTTTISLVVLTILWITKKYFESFILKRFSLKNIIIPIDIICIICLVILSYMFNLNENYAIDIVSPINSPTVEVYELKNIIKIINFKYISHLLSSALVISLIIYVTSYSLANIFATRHQYKISANQELIALGFSNLLSSFAQCYPSCGSLSRSLVQERVGAKTQASSFISVLFVTIFALKFTHLLALLPKCGLSAIIVCALIPSLFKLNQLKHFWNVSKLDGIVWSITFVTVTIIGIQTGLLIGLTLSTFHFLINTFSVTNNILFEHKCDGHILRIAVKGPLFKWNIKLFHRIFEEKLSKHNKTNITRIWLDLEKVIILDDYSIIYLQNMFHQMNNNAKTLNENILFELIAGSIQNHQRILKHAELKVPCHLDRMSALSSTQL